jgi:ABC-2 type transport system permease protein
MNARSFAMLVRREFWEHRGLVWAPVVTAVLLVVLTFVGSAQTGGVQVQVGGEGAGFMREMSGASQLKFFGVFIGAMLVPQLVVALIVLFFYLLDCLYTERRDRSILFWKSLPVSDSATVLAKTSVALVAVPLFVYALSVVVSALSFAAVALKVSGTPYAALGTWHTGAWFAIQGTLLVNLLVASLWYAPLTAYLLLVSAWAPRAVVLWAVLPPLLLNIAERVALGTQHVSDFLGDRLWGYFQAMGMAGPQSRASAGYGSGAELMADLYRLIDVSHLLSSADLWLGVVAAAAMIWGAIRLRRWRDDG